MCAEQFKSKQQLEPFALGILPLRFTSINRITNQLQPTNRLNCDLTNEERNSIGCQFQNLVFAEGSYR